MIPVLLILPFQKTVIPYFHKDKKECDFIIKKELSIVSAIQVCYELEDLNTKEREIAGLLEALKQYNLKEGLLLTFSEEDLISNFKESENSEPYKIIIKPVWKWLLENK